MDLKLFWFVNNSGLSSAKICHQILKKKDNSDKAAVHPERHLSWGKTDFPLHQPIVRTHSPLKVLGLQELFLVKTQLLS